MGAGRAKVGYEYGMIIRLFPGGRLLLQASLWLTACGAILNAAAQENWPQFRGPGARGVGDSATLPLQWAPGTNVVWRTAVPGRGWSSPIVWGERIFLTTAVSEGDLEEPKKGLYFGGDRPEPRPHRQHWQVLCVDFKDGHVLWQKEVAAATPSTP